MKHPRVLPAIVALCGAVLGTAASADDDRSFTFRVETPKVQAFAQSDAYSELRLPGFERHDAAVGAPDVPTRTVLVAIPAGAMPTLTVRRTGTRSFLDVQPRPVPHIGYVPEPDGDSSRRGGSRPAKLRERRLYEVAAASYQGEGTLPERVAWLGKTGILRDQRYVEVHLAPVRFDRRRGGLVVDAGLELTIRFEGDFTPSVSPAEPDRFESVYRRTFENYAQGRRFRLRAQRLEKAPLAPPRGATDAGGGPMRRVRVRENGPVRLDYALFAAHAPEFLTSDPRNWRLAGRGESIPLHLHQSGSDETRLESGEWVQFYGQALDDEPATVLNYDKPANPYENLYAARDFSDEGVYFLTIEASAQPSMEERDAAPPVGAGESNFVAVARREIDDEFLPIPEELWFWGASVSETSGARTHSVPLPGLAEGTLPARVRLYGRGFLDCPGVSPDHKTRVSLENALLQTLELPVDNPNNEGNQNVLEHDGNEFFEHDIEWVHEGGDPLLTDPLSVVLDAALVPGTCPTGGSLMNENFLDAIEVEYRRAFVAHGDILTFDYPDGDALFEVAGFTTSAVHAYEITDQLGSSGVVDARRLTGVEVALDGQTQTHHARFRMDEDPGRADGTPRRFLVVGDGVAATPPQSDFEADRVSTLLSDATQADLVVIAHADLIPSECSEGGGACSHDVDCAASETDRCVPALETPLEKLLTWRSNQGITSRVARLQDLEDEFNLGLGGPDAIRNFLAWVLAGGWNPPAPAYVMLVGDGSYDYKGGTGSGNYVPTQVMVKHSEQLAHFASDNLLGAVLGDDHLADLTVGRIPARTSDEADDVLGKILDSDELAPPGPWRSSALFISDRGKDYSVSEALKFEQMNADAAGHMDIPPYGITMLRYWSDICGGVPSGCNAGVMKQKIKDHVNAAIGEGAALAQFVGHGNWDLWSDDVFFCANEQNPYCSADDTTHLSNRLLEDGPRLPFLIVHNCLTAGFHSLNLKSFGEQWMKWPEGGAMAVYAPSGLGYRFIGNAVIKVMWDDIFGKHKERMLATPVLNSQTQLCTQGSIEACQSYTLLGDPSSRLALPDVAPATGLVATASEGTDASVELSWTASTTPGATYDVYRTLWLEQVYTRINGDEPIAGTSFTDTDVQHTRTYYYYVVASDAGFESAWSNFNSDCGEPPGDDCVQARPVNLTPPAVPTGLTVTDAESGGRLDLVWNPNDEVDIQGYTVHFGTTPAYGQTRTFTGTFGYLGGLDNGTPYYVGIQARNTSQTESEISDPAVMGVPLQILGVKAPDLVRDLRLAKSGSDAELTWGAVTQDIYGRAVAVSHYEVFRGTEAAFVPASGEAHATEVGTVYVDGEALTDGAEAYFYLVRAVDGSGNAGGLGRQLPEGIRDLRIVPSDTPPDAIDLSWSAVTTDFDGHPTTVVYYEVYASDEPFGRGDLEDGAVALVAPMVVGPTVQILPTGPERYYSVLAVDARGNRSPF